MADDITRKAWLRAEETGFAIPSGEDFAHAMTAPKTLRFKKGERVPDWIAQGASVVFSCDVIVERSPDGVVIRPARSDG